MFWRSQLLFCFFTITSTDVLQCAFHTRNFPEVPVDAEVCVRGNESALENLLTDDWGERVNSGSHIRLDQPRVLWTWHTHTHTMITLLFSECECEQIHMNNLMNTHLGLDQQFSTFLTPFRIIVGAILIILFNLYKCVHLNTNLL